MQFVVSKGRGGRLNSFTLVELLTVVLIIAILAGLTLAAGEGVMTQAARSRARAEIKAMSAALESYKSDNGIYPAYDYGGGTNAYKISDGSATAGPYLTASTLIYQSLAGKINFSDASFTAPGGKSYMTFKADQVGNATAGAGAAYVQDPFGYAYGYSTGDTAAVPPTAPYNGNGFFDLWSTGGALTTSTPPDPTPAWISNWAQ